ncbi:hypothetical protein EVA_11725 [gut metagenome]|uniref:Uncharacterized protein n=1 Tax=gut metagenome TaxID=749906 RepID=J9CJD7_9ZZZZ
MRCAWGGLPPSFRQTRLKSTAKARHFTIVDGAKTGKLCACRAELR